MRVPNVSHATCTLIFIDKDDNNYVHICDDAGEVRVDLKMPDGPLSLDAQRFIQDHHE